MNPIHYSLTGKAIAAGLALCAAAMSQSWQFNQPMLAPGARYGNTAVTAPDGFIYAIGGIALNSYKPVFLASNIVSRYDPVQSTWTASVATLNTARAFHASVVGCDGKIAVMGGTDAADKALSSVEVYDPAANQLTALPSMNSAHGRLAASVGPDCKIYAVSNDTDPSTGGNLFEVFDGTSWTSGALPVSVNAYSPLSIYGVVTGHDGHIYALAGGTEYDLNPASATPAWQEVTAANAFSGPGSYPPAAATFGIDGNIYALDHSYLYPIHLPDWLSPNSFSKPSHYKEFAATTAEGRIYTVGGSDSDPSIASYGDLKAALGPYKAWWNFRGNTSVPDYSCYLPTYTTYNRTTGHVGLFAASLTGNVSFKAPAACTDIAAGDFSIEFWMKHDGTAAPFAVQSILDKRTNTSGYHGYHVYFYNNMGAKGGTIGLQMANQTGGYANYGSSVAIPKDQWTHVAITVHRAAKGGAIWINGVLAGQFSPMSGTLTSTAQLNIGGHNFTTAYFKGQLDELTLYDRALNFAEVRSIVLAGAQGKQ